MRTGIVLVKEISFLQTLKTFLKFIIDQEYAIKFIIQKQKNCIKDNY